MRSAKSSGRKVRQDASNGFLSSKRASSCVRSHGAHMQFMHTSAGGMLGFSGYQPLQPLAHYQQLRVDFRFQRGLSLQPGDTVTIR